MTWYQKHRILKHPVYLVVGSLAGAAIVALFVLFVTYIGQPIVDWIGSLAPDDFWLGLLLVIMALLVLLTLYFIGRSFFEMERL